MSTEFATLEDEGCVVVFTEGVNDVDAVFGPFNDEDEANTFIACGPHGMEDSTEYAHVCPLYPPHAMRLDSTGHEGLLDVSL